MISIRSIDTPSPRSRVRLLVLDDGDLTVITSAATVREMGLSDGDTFESISQMQDAITSAEYPVALERAYEVIGYRDRSIRELSDALKRDGYSGITVRSVLDRLLELGYLDDEAYAARYVRSALGARKGLRKITHELEKRGVNSEYIDAALQSSTDEPIHDIEQENARAIATRIVRPGCDRRERERALRRLVAKGYSFEVARDAVGWAFLDGAS